MEKSKKVQCTIISILIIMSLIINLSKPQNSYLENLTSVNVFLGMFATIGIYKIIYKRHGKEKNKKIFTAFAAIMAIVNSISYYYHYYGNLENMFNPLYQPIKAIILTLGQSLMYYYIFSYVNSFFQKAKKKIIKNNIINYIFEKHPIKSIIILLIIIYIPLVFITYPGDMSPDGFDELRQFYHVNTWSVNYINLIDEDIYINTHHSVLHTLWIGTINEIGNMIHSPNIGLFLNVLIQIGLTIFVLTYCMYIMKKIKTPIIIRIGVLLFYILSGFVLIPSTAIYKDVPFSLFVLLYSVMLMELAHDENLNYKKLINISITALIMSLVAKKGIYAVILVFIAILFFQKTSKKKKALLSTPIIIYFVLESIIFPNIGITSGSSREMLAIPLQQVSRTVVMHDKELTNSEKSIIDEIIEYDDIKTKYNAKNADPIKNDLFKKDYTSKEMKDFLKLYISNFFEYPKTYIDAFLNSTSGYFFLGRTVGPGGYKTDEFRMSTKKMTYHKDEWRIGFMQNVDKIYEIIQKIPIINLIYVMAAYVWIPIYALVYILAKKEKNKFIPLIPALIMIAFLLVSPVNNNRRYVFPLFYVTPMIIGYISTLKNRKITKES